MGHARESWSVTQGTGYLFLIHVGTRVIELLGAVCCFGSSREADTYKPLQHSGPQAVFTYFLLTSSAAKA